MTHPLKTLVIALTILTIPANSLAFDPNYIISDYDLTNPFALDRNQIQAFLDRGYLGDYKTEDTDGKTRYAADIIWRAAQQHLISPKFILALIQKEQSLVEDDNPSDSQLDWAAGYAVCDDCSKSDPNIQRWKGFAKQIRSSSMQFIEGYLADIEADGTTKGKYGPGVAVSIDGTTVIPQNAATASMYAYTPHLHGNENLSIIWKRWFSTEYPTGTLVKSDIDETVYLIQYGYKRAIKSMSALISRFDSNLIITVSDTSLDNYPDGTPISFPNYSLLQDEDGTIYLLVNDTLRPIDSLETFQSIGFMEDEINQVSDEDVGLYEIGSTITQESIHPKGTLLRLATTGALFFVQDGIRHPIFDNAVLESRFPGALVGAAAPVEIEQFREGTPLGIPDGRLIKATEDPTVYVISETRRLAIPSAEIFLDYGWSWDDILTVSDKTLNLHDLGDPIEGADSSIASN